MLIRIIYQNRPQSLNITHFLESHFYLSRSSNDCERVRQRMDADHRQSHIVLLFRKTQTYFGIFSMDANDAKQTAGMSIRLIEHANCDRSHVKHESFCAFRYRTECAACLMCDLSHRGTWISSYCSPSSYKRRSSAPISIKPSVCVTDLLFMSQASVRRS